MNIVEKKKLLRKLLAESKRGFHMDLVRHLSISLKTLWNWEKGKQWPNLEQERELWNQLGYTLCEDGEVRQQAPVGAGAPSLTAVSTLLALVGEIVAHHRATAALYASLEQLLAQGVTVSTTPEMDAAVRHLQRMNSEGRHTLSSLQPPVPTLPPLLPETKTYSLTGESEYDS